MRRGENGRGLLEDDYAATATDPDVTKDDQSDIMLYLADNTVSGAPFTVPQSTQPWQQQYPPVFPMRYPPSSEGQASNAMGGPLIQPGQLVVSHAPQLAQSWCASPPKLSSPGQLQSPFSVPLQPKLLQPPAIVPLAEEPTVLPADTVGATGTCLTGSNIVITSTPLVKGEGSKGSGNVKVTTITIYNTPASFYTGRLVAVTTSVVAYAVTVSKNTGGAVGHAIRAVSLRSEAKALVKGHQAPLADLVFGGDTVPILASVDVEGGIMVTSFTEENGHLLFTMMLTVTNKATCAPAAHALCWYHVNYNIFAVSHGNAIEMWNLPQVLGDNRSTAVTREEVTIGVVRFSGHSQPINSIAFSHDGKLLASGSEDGHVLVWDITTILDRPSKDLFPHSGRPVTFVAFAPAMGHGAASGSHWLITGGDNNNSVAVWSLSTEQCVQRITFKSVSGQALEHHARMDSTGQFLVLSNFDNCTLHVMGLGQGSDGSAVFETLREFTLGMPALSFVVGGCSLVKPASGKDGYPLEEEGDGSEEMQMAMHCVHPKAIQTLVLHFPPNVPRTQHEHVPEVLQDTDTTGGGIGAQGAQDATSSPVVAVPDVLSINDLTSALDIRGTNGGNAVDDGDQTNAELSDMEGASMTAMASTDLSVGWPVDTPASAPRAAGQPTNTSGKDSVPCTAQTRPNLDSLAVATSTSPQAALTSLVPSMPPPLPPVLSGWGPSPAMLQGPQPQSSHPLQWLPPLFPPNQMPFGTAGGSDPTLLAAIKEMIAESEQRTVDRTEKLLAAQRDTIRQDVEGREKLGKERTKQLATSVAATIQEMLVEQLDQAMARILVPTMKAKLSDSLSAMAGDLTTKVVGPVQSSVTTAMEARVGPAMERSLETTVSNLFGQKKVVDSMVQAATASLRVPMVDAFTESFNKILIPACEAATQSMFVHVKEALDTATQEYIQSVENTGSMHRQPVQIQSSLEALNMFLYGLQTATEQLPKTIAWELKSQMVSLEMRLTRQLDRTVRSMQGNAKAASRLETKAHPALLHDPPSRRSQPGTLVGVPPPLPPNQTPHAPQASTGWQVLGYGPHIGAGATPHPPMDQKAHETWQAINRLLVQEKYNDAFIQALSMSNVMLVERLCQTVDVVEVLQTTPCPLDQAVLMSLCQQLGSDMSSDPWMKAYTIRYALARMNLQDITTRTHLPTILEELAANLANALGMEGHGTAPLSESSIRGALDAVHALQQQTAARA